MTRSCIDGGAVRVEQPLRLGAIEASHVYPADLRRPSGVVDEMFPVRKDERRSMIVLSALELCGDGWLATGAPALEIADRLAFGANRIVPSACHAPPRAVGASARI